MEEPTIYDEINDDSVARNDSGFNTTQDDEDDDEEIVRLVAALRSEEADKTAREESLRVKREHLRKLQDELGLKPKEKKEDKKADLLKRLSDVKEAKGKVKKERDATVTSLKDTLTRSRDSEELDQEEMLDDLLLQEMRKLQKEKVAKKDRVREKMEELRLLRSAHAQEVERKKMHEALKKAKDDRRFLEKSGKKKAADAERLKEELKRIQMENERKMEEAVKAADLTRELSYTLEKERRVETTLMKRKEEIAQLLRLLKKPQIVDFCFLVDATGSMSSYINQVRDEIKDTVTELSMKHSHLKLNLAFVAYRDHCDAEKSYGQYSILPFTDSLEKFKDFVGTVKADGGGDGPEDVFGGFQKAISLDWSAPMTRVLIHIADAPCHGKRFHSLSDDYPAGDPKGLKAEDLLKQLRVDCNIFNFLFCRINNSTDKMIEEFKGILSEHSDWLKVMSLTSLDILMETVSKTISSSIYDSETRTVATFYSRGGGKMKEFTLDTNIPENWNEFPIKKYECKYFVLPELPDPKPAKIAELVKSDFEMRTSHGVIQIAPNPFAEGALRIAFHAKERGQHDSEMKPCVIKDYKKLDIKRNALEKHVSEMETQAIASFFANCFSKVKPKGAKDMSYLPTETIEIDSEYFSKEQYLDGSFQKFNNNWGWVDEESFSASIQAFSHWTYDVTTGYLIVVDLQGKKNDSVVLLTDPVIHCKNLARFGRTNLGFEGISKFFMSHACNKVCLKMKLRPHPEQPLFKKAPVSATVLFD